MLRIRISTLVWGAFMLVFLTLLIALKDTLLAAHIDETIQFVTSDAATYFTLYENVYSEVSLGESLSLLLIGIPILSMKLADGSLLIVQIFNLILMGITLRFSLNCFSTLMGRMAFIFGALIFPYFLFGFLGLNKEIYAMCAAILFACYLIKGDLLTLLFALVLAFLARYYMVLSLVAMVAFFPRTKPPRYWLIVFSLLLISLLAPSMISLIPGYSGEDVKEVSGWTGVIFSQAIGAYAYAIVYPIKYLALIPQRAYSVLIGTERAADYMEAAVSILSLVAFLGAIKIFLSQPRANLVVRRLIIAGLVAPMPMMWSDIMHWRYYSFVYFFFLAAVIFHYFESHGRSPKITVSSSDA